jgi:multidrug efflux pump subunit AcrB
MNSLNKKTGIINVSAWSIRNPVSAVMLFVLLTVAGLFSFSSMKVQYYPDLDVPTISVVALLPDATPAQIEAQVAQKIENSIAALPLLKHIYTKAQSGAVTVTAEFRIEKSGLEALEEVRSAIQRVRPELPARMREPIVSKLDLAGLPVLAYTIWSPTMDAKALSLFMDQTVTKTLMGVRGVGAVARVGGVNTDQQEESHSVALLNGKTVVGFEVTRSRGASEVEVGAGVTKALTTLRAAYPHIKIETAFDFVEPVKEEYHGSLKLLYEGAFLAVLVVWFFLRDWRATFISAIALPLSVIPAFIGMRYLGFSINVVTLLALSLVVGILVDDAIVEVENIVRHLRMGKSPYQAAMEAADEIGLAVIATTFTLVAVFLPTAFMGGIAGKFFKQFGWTASFAVFTSLVVARVLTPMMAAYMLRPLVAQQEQNGWLMRRYLAWAALCLKHRLWTMLAAGAFFVGSVMLIPLLSEGFIPADDLSQTQVNIELPLGSTLEQTLAVAEKTRLLIKDISHVKSIYTTAGGGLAGGDPFSPIAIAEVRKATLTITLTPHQDRVIKKQEIEDQLRAALSKLTGAMIRVGLGSSGEKYALMLVSDDPEALAQTVVKVERDLKTLSRVGSIASSAAQVDAEINRYDRSRNVSFEIELSNMELGDVKEAVRKLNSIKNLPPSVRQVEVGDAEVQDELFASFSWAMLTGVLCIYIVLVLLFKDFMQPGTILAALPLSLGGAFVALLLTDKSFSMPSLIGLIMLMGIATKNSILLVEYAILARKVQGMTRFEALLDACHKRARPIVMTTIAMAAGMLPVAMGWGNADPSFRSPMATAVIGGLVTSTFLSLLVIPVVFTYVDDAARFLAKWILRKRN